MPKVYFKCLPCFPPKGACLLCLSNTVDEYLLGPIYKLSDITLHYYCLLMASKVEQNGADHQGLLGFFARDIRRELKRGSLRGCHYCRKKGATVACSYPKCRKVFHLPCGIKRGSLHRFYNDFRSFCGSHRPRQKVPLSVRDEAKTCDVCTGRIEKNTISYIWPTCCRPPASLFHRLCLQKMACSAGYYFKCPLCNNREVFIKEMKKNGIYVPEQDSSWEREPNAYSELTERRNYCEAEVCRCSKGRTFKKNNSEWEVEACWLCGGSGVHVACSSIPNQKIQRKHFKWYCQTCKPFANTHTGDEKKTGNIDSEANIRGGNLGEEVCRIYSERGQEDEIIDVESEGETVNERLVCRKRGAEREEHSKQFNQKFNSSVVEEAESKGGKRESSSGSSSVPPSTSRVSVKGGTMLECVSLNRRQNRARSEELKEMLKELEEEQKSMNSSQGVSPYTLKHQTANFKISETHQVMTLLRVQPKVLLSDVLREKNILEKYLKVTPPFTISSSSMEKENASSGIGPRPGKRTESSLLPQHNLTSKNTRDFDMTLKLSVEEDGTPSPKLRGKEALKQFLCKNRHSSTEAPHSLNQTQNLESCLGDVNTLALAKPLEENENLKLQAKGFSAEEIQCDFKEDSTLTEKLPASVNKLDSTLSSNFYSEKGCQHLMISVDELNSILSKSVQHSSKTALGSEKCEAKKIKLTPRDDSFGGGRRTSRGKSTKRHVSPKNKILRYFVVLNSKNGSNPSDNSPLSEYSPGGS